jgi:hypothetical protein
MEYINALYTVYEERAEHGDNDINTLEQPLERMGRFRDKLDRYANAIIQELGMGVEWRTLVEIAKPIRFVIWALEEMICEAMISENELLAAYRTSSLTFQQV